MGCGVSLCETRHTHSQGEDEDDQGQSGLANTEDPALLPTAARYRRLGQLTLCVTRQSLIPWYACGLQWWKAKAYEHTISHHAWLLDSSLHAWFCPCLSNVCCVSSFFRLSTIIKHVIPLPTTLQPVPHSHPPCYHRPLPPLSLPGASPSRPAARPAQR